MPKVSIIVPVYNAEKYLRECGALHSFREWFNPMDSVTGKLTKTANTYSVHWYSMSWLPKRTQIKARLGRIWRRTWKAIGR